MLRFHGVKLTLLKPSLSECGCVSIYVLCTVSCMLYLSCKAHRFYMILCYWRMYLTVVQFPLKNKQIFCYQMIVFPQLSNVDTITSYCLQTNFNLLPAYLGLTCLLSGRNRCPAMHICSGCHCFRYVTPQSALISLICCVIYTLLKLYSSILHCQDVFKWLQVVIVF